MPSKNAYQSVENNEKQSDVVNTCSNSSGFIIATCFFVGLILVHQNSSMFYPNDRSLTQDNVVTNEQTISPANDNITVNQYAEKSDMCAGKYIYVMDLPSEFNTDFLDNCSIISPWFESCKLLSNSGLGIQINTSSSDENVFSGTNWYDTDQFSLEVIFHNRMKQYNCLTSNYSEASAVFVPFYAGLDAGRYLWISNATLRDEASIRLVEFMREKPEWKRFGGRDHFLIAARPTWDFSRGSENPSPDGDPGWGNRLFKLPEIKNMTSLSFEASVTSLSEFAIPYPTYFHPTNGNEVDSWQEEMRRKNRTHLFSFAGAPRPNNTESIRNILIDQCLGAQGENCKFLHMNPSIKPENLMNLFQISDFCLQPPGDSLTRKSIFDTMIAGCIPVLFHPGSAYVQYVWHLPKDYSSYSVLIPIYELKQGNVSIEKILLEIPKEKIIAMREEVIKLIPKIVYANTNSKVDNFEDAFEVSMKGVLNRVERLKNGTIESVPDELAWKYKFYGNLENHEWDKYFGLA